MNVGYTVNPIKNYVKHTLADTELLRLNFEHMNKPVSLEEGINNIIGD